MGHVRNLLAERMYGLLYSSLAACYMSTSG